MRLDKMEFGMKIRSQFQTALERQVGEAVAIRREQASGTILLNSKGEYNRCKIKRIETRPTKSQYRDTLLENENDKLFKEGLKELNKLKRSRTKEIKRKKNLKVTSNLNKKLKEVCIEIGNENLSNWRKRRKLEIDNEKKTDVLDKEILERQVRRNIAMSKKTKTLKTLRMKNVIPKEKLSVEECKLKTENRRNYRKKKK